MQNLQSDLEQTTLLPNVPSTKRGSDSPAFYVVEDTDGTSRIAIVGIEPESRIVSDNSNFYHLKGLIRNKYSERLKQETNAKHWSDLTNRISDMISVHIPYSKKLGDELSFVSDNISSLATELLIDKQPLKKHFYQTLCENSILKIETDFLSRFDERINPDLYFEKFQKKAESLHDFYNNIKFKEQDIKKIINKLYSTVMKTDFSLEFILPTNDYSLLSRFNNDKLSVFFEFFLDEENNQVDQNEDDEPDVVINVYSSKNLIFNWGGKFSASLELIQNKFK